MYSKAKLFNLALNFCLLSRQIIDPENDKSTEAKVLIANWEPALFMVLADLDLNRTATEGVLEYIENDPTPNWRYSYKYPSKCANFRRIQSEVEMDSEDTHINMRTATKDGVSVIFTNEADAIGEWIPTDVPLSSLSAPAGIAVAIRLAILSAPLITGKGSKTLLESLESKYKVAKAEAKEIDANENRRFFDPMIESSFVRARTT